MATSTTQPTRDEAEQRAARVRPWEILLILTAAVGDAVLTGVGLGPDELVHHRTGEPAGVALVILAIVALAAPLALRRRYPMGVLLWTVAVCAVLAFWLEYSQPIVCLLVALFTAARQTSPPWSWVALALGGVQVALTVMVVGRSHEPGDGPGELAFVTFFFGVLVLAVWAAGRRDHAATARALTLTEQLDVRAHEASRAERQRIARELHDILAHSVSAMMMQAAGARAITGSIDRDDPDDPRVRSVQEALSSIERTGSQSMRELHRLLGTLRGDDAGSTLDLDADMRPSAQPGLGDLDELVETPRSNGLIVEVHRVGEPGEVDPSVGTAAYRVVQESLTNALKHAGRGAVVDVYESWHTDELQVQVRSRASHHREAATCETPGSGTGLAGLRERVELAGGTFDSGWVGDDFVTTAVLPTRPAAARPVGTADPDVPPRPDRAG